MSRKKCLFAMAVALFSAAAGVTTATAQEWGQNQRIRHVLLVSIDGMHAVDYLNCSKGLSSVNGGTPYCPHLAELGQTGVNYLDTSTSPRPSDSFPGLMALMTGGTPRTFGLDAHHHHGEARSEPH